MRTATTPWALGDYDRFARALVWELGAELVAACGIGPGQRVLDVAAGTGNVALRAAAAGAQVVASDMTPESLATGERRAREAGIALESVVADAQALPFADASFDVVTSAFGAIFAPDHAAVAASCSASAGRAGRSGWSTSRRRATPPGSSARWRRTRRRRRPAPGPARVGRRGARPRAARPGRGVAPAHPPHLRRAPSRRPRGIRGLRDRDVRARDRHARGAPPTRPRWTATCSRSRPRRTRGRRAARPRSRTSTCWCWPSGPSAGRARRRARRGTSGSRARCRP